MLCSCGYFLSSFFLPSLFLAYSQRSETGCLLYFHTRCGLSANLERRSEMCCTQLAGNTGRKNDEKRSPSAHHRTTLLGCIFVNNARIDNGKNLLDSNISSTCMPSQYGERRPTSGWDRFGSLGHPSKFQRLSHLGFVTAPTSLTEGQSNFARCLAVYWAGTLHIHFRGLLPGAKFTLRPSLALSYIGSVTARHSSSERQPNFAGWYKEWNYATFEEGATYIRLSGHHVVHRPTF